MTLLKTRPTIELLLPRSITIGSRFEAEVRLQAPEDVEVEHVHVDLRCKAGWTIGSGKSQVSRYDELLGLRAKPFSGPKLTRGDHSFRATFELPPHLPPSYEGGVASVRWTMDVEVSIPWWPDARSHHGITVRLPDAHTADPRPAIFRTQESHRGAPRIEASLASSAIAPGGRVAGAVALLGFDAEHPFPIRVGLLEHETLVTRSDYARSRPGRSWFVKVESPAGDHARPTPFEFLIPNEVVPDFRCPPFAHEFRLEIEVKTGLFSSSKLTIPVVVANDRVLKDESSKLIAPSVGASRLAEIGGEVAVRRGYAIDADTLTRNFEIGGLPVGIGVRHESRAGEGTLLVADLTFPRLGLDLAVEPQTGIAGYFARDIEAGEPLWDRLHRVSARDDVQTSAWLKTLLPRLDPDDWTFERVGDESARLSVQDAALTAESLDAFVLRVERVAQAIASVIGLVPPPTGVDVGPEWTSLAARLGARFVVGDLAIDDGKLGNTKVVLETRWESVPLHVIEVSPDPPLPEEVSFAFAAPKTDVARSTELSADVIAVLARLPGDAMNLRISGGTAKIELPFERVGEAFRARPAEVSSAIDVLARLGPLFGVHRGPFR